MRDNGLDHCISGTVGERHFSQLNRGDLPRASFSCSEKISSIIMAILPPTFSPAAVVIKSVVSHDPLPSHVERCLLLLS